MTAIFLPSSPTTGQEYVATNGATYIWLGNRWNTSIPISNGTAVFYYEGGDSTTWSTADQVNPGDITLDGGTSEG
jgi:hypothetical protein